MQSNRAKARLKAGEPVLGCFVRNADAALVEVLGYLGWDVLVFDGEHGTIEPRDCEHLVRAAELRGVTPIARVAANQPQLILRMLDTGVQGVHVPWVNSAAEAEAVVQAVKYGPRGVRGLAGVRAASYGFGEPLGTYVRRANAETLTVIHIETITAVEQIDAICAVPDLDVIFVGPNDLAHSMGLPGEMEHPAVLAAIEQVLAAAERAGVAFGINVGSAASARHWRERGARYITIALEAVLRPAVQSYLAEVRGS
jgi:4-hydroxy-2-oxoheptanedioate aldolase